MVWYAMYGTCFYERYNGLTPYTNGTGDTSRASWDGMGWEYNLYAVYNAYGRDPMPRPFFLKKNGKVYLFYLGKVSTV